MFDYSWFVLPQKTELDYKKANDSHGKDFGSINFASTSTIGYFFRFF